MNIDHINYLYDNNLLNTGSVKILYDFTQAGEILQNESGEYFMIANVARDANDLYIFAKSGEMDTLSGILTTNEGISIIGGITSGYSCLNSSGIIGEASGVPTSGDFTIAMRVEMLTAKDIFGTGEVQFVSMGSFPTYSLIWDSTGVPSVMGFSGENELSQFVWTGSGGDAIMGAVGDWGYYTDPAYSPVSVLNTDEPTGIWDIASTYYLTSSTSITGRLADSGSVFDTSIIMSSFQSGITSSGWSNPSGFEIGLNSVNSLYFKTTNGWNESMGWPVQTVLTLDGTNNAENIWFVKKSQNNLSILRYDPETSGVNGKSFSLQEAIYDSSGSNRSLYLGYSPSANSNQRGLSVFASGATCGFGNVAFRDFAFVDYMMSDSAMVSMSQAMLSDAHQSVTGSEYTFLTVTGTVESCQDISGIVSTQKVLSGYMVITHPVTGKIVYTDLYGDVSSGNSFYEKCGEGSFFEDTADQDRVGVITGWSTGYSVSFINESIPVYIDSGVSGVIGEDCSTEYLYGTGTGVSYETGYGVSGYDESSILSDDFSIMLNASNEDFVEAIYGFSLESGNIALDKVISAIGTSFALKNGQSGSAITNIFINGYAKKLGIDISGYDNDTREIVLYEGYQADYGIMDRTDRTDNSFPYYDLTINILGQERQLFFSGYGGGKFVWTGSSGQLMSGVPGDWQFTSSGEDFTGNSYSVEPIPFLNLSDGSFISDRLKYSDFTLSISNTGQYGTEFPEIFPSGNQVFFNGKKLYRDIDFTGEFNFTPISWVLQETGIFFTFPQLQGSTSVTGRGFNSINVPESRENSAIFFVNGVRMDTEKVLAHAASKDLISGLFEFDFTGIVVEDSI